MNNRGTQLLLGILIAGMLFAFGMLVMNFIKPEISIATSSLDCDNLAISDGTKLTCLGIDLVLPYFIILVISIAGGIIATKLTL